MQRLVENPVSRPLFQRGALLAIQDDADYVLMLTLTQDGGLGAQLHHATDPAVEQADCRIRFEPADFLSVAQGQGCPGAPDISGKDAALARQVMHVLGIQEAATQHGPSGVGAGSLDMTRSMILDAQLAPGRRTFGVFSARDPGPHDCREWRIEAGVRPQDGIHFAVSVGLTDPGCPVRARNPERGASGLGHELVMLTDAAGAAGDWHVGILATMLREIANTERPFTSADWIDYDRPLVRGGTCEGFLVTESTLLESPYALDGGMRGRFFIVIGVTRRELDLLNGQKEPARLRRLLDAELGNAEITDPFRDTIQLY